MHKHKQPWPRRPRGRKSTWVMDWLSWRWESWSSNTEYEKKSGGANQNSLKLADLRSVQLLEQHSDLKVGIPARFSYHFGNELPTRSCLPPLGHRRGLEHLEGDYQFDSIWSRPRHRGAWIHIIFSAWYMVKRQSECVEMWPESFRVWPAVVFGVWGWNAGHVASASRATDARMSHPPSRAPFHGLLCNVASWMTAVTIQPSISARHVFDCLCIYAVHASR